MKFVIIAFMLIATVLTQKMGGGVGKSTWASSSPRVCAAWFSKYLPATENTNDCTPDGKCECATQGRFVLDSTNFGVHTNNCTFHPYGDQSIEDIEKKI